MDEKHRKLLQKHRMAIAKDLEPLRVFVYLASLDTFTTEDEEEVKSMTSRSARVEKLLDILPRREQGAFECFVRALEKESPHLAKPLLEESGLPPSETDEELGMSRHHKKILRESRHQLGSVDMEALLAKLNIFNANDKEAVTSCKTSSEKVDELISILIRKGPDAFHDFLSVLEQVDSKIAKFFAAKGDHLSSPVQETETLISGNTLVQDLLFTKLLDNFKRSMDEEDDFGNGWKTLYKELELPGDKISVFQEKQGSPTENVLTAWCKRLGSAANVATLLQAVARCHRGDCLHQLEIDLNCKLSEMEELNSRMSSLGIEQADGIRHAALEFLRDLSESRLHAISSNLPNDKTEPLKRKLEDKCQLSSLSDLTMKEALQRCGGLKIRNFMEILKDLECENVIIAARKQMPSGTTGPLQREEMFVRDMTYQVRRDITMALSGDDTWRRLGAELNMPNQNLQFIEARSQNPGDEVLRYWEVKAGSRVGTLYDCLVKIGCPLIADKL